MIRNHRMSQRGGVRALAAALLVAAGSFLSLGLRAEAAPQTMPDGTVFDPEYYAAQNPDVVAALGDGEEMLYRHYQAYGKAEGRLPYAAAADVAGANGSTDTVNSGVYTLEDGTVFDAAYYAARYPDVAEAFGTDPAVLLRHYLSLGRAEGRWSCAQAASVAHTSDGVTEAVAYHRLAALQSEFPEGSRWEGARDVYAFRSLPQLTYYGTGDAAYAFMLNDRVFGQASVARIVYNYHPDEIRTGDILRFVDSDGQRSAVALSVTDQDVEIVSADAQGTVRWGQRIRWAALKGGFIHQITRYL